MTIGILAYGSLIPNPGAEIAAVTVDRITGVETPFRVEFSRSSRVRDGAPTLVPVKRGGAGVSGVVLVLHDSVGETAAQDMLYRRERNRVGSGDVYADVDQTNIDSAFLGRLDHFAGLDVVFHAALRANIEEPTPEMLARLAIASAAAPSGAVARDGISYLKAAKDSGIVHAAYGRLRTGEPPSDRRPRPRGSPLHRPQDIVLTAPAHRRDVRRPLHIRRGRRLCLG